MMNISNSQIKFFKKNGYLIVKNIIKKKEVKILKTKLEALEKKNFSKKIRGTYEPGVKKSLIHDLHKRKEFIKIIISKTYTKICNYLVLPAADQSTITQYFNMWEETINLLAEKNRNDRL